MWTEGIPTQPPSGLQAPREATAGGPEASQAWGVDFQVLPLHLGPGPGPGPGSLGSRPSASQASLGALPLLSLRWLPRSSLWAGRGHRGRGLGSSTASGFLSLVREDSLTPEHINILNDGERSWGSRQPWPLRLPSPPLLLTHSSFFLFSLSPRLLSPSSSSHSCPSQSPLSFPLLSLSYCLSSLFLFLSLCFLSPLLPFSFSPRTSWLLGTHKLPPPEAGGGVAGPVPLAVCASPAGTRCLAGWQQTPAAGPTQWGPATGG